jgi:hypothetical protein
MNFVDENNVIAMTTTMEDVVAIAREMPEPTGMSPWTRGGVGEGAAYPTIIFSMPL